MDAAIDLSDPSKALDLANIRYQLIRLEDTITFNLIERVQFPLNASIYRAGGVAIPDSPLSLMDWVLSSHERLHSLVRRYQSPDEHPFFPHLLCEPILPALHYPPVLHPNTVNFNAQLKAAYVDAILPAACGARFDHRPERPEAQENYGSAAVADVLCLQALSRRVHFGKFVAEAKFRAGGAEGTAKYVDMIRRGDRRGLADSITDAKVEEKVLQRLRLKARTYGTDPSVVGAAEANDDEDRAKINVDAVVSMYKDHVIPLTKEVEVEYLMQRLKGTEWE